MGQNQEGMLFANVHTTQQGKEIQQPKQTCTNLRLFSIRETINRLQLILSVLMKRS